MVNGFGKKGLKIDTTYRTQPIGNYEHYNYGDREDSFSLKSAFCKRSSYSIGARSHHWWLLIHVCFGRC